MYKKRFKYIGKHSKFQFLLYIFFKEKELSHLRAEVEHLSGLSVEMDKLKEELKKSEAANAELKHAVEAKEKNVRELEDSIFVSFFS